MPPGHEQRRLGHPDHQGEALHRQGHEYGDSEAFEEAVAAYRAALEGPTRGRAPLGWAGVQVDPGPGPALWTLGERAGGVPSPREAPSRFRSAREVCRGIGQPSRETRLAEAMGEAERHLGDLERLLEPTRRPRCRTSAASMPFPSS